MDSTNALSSQSPSQSPSAELTQEELKKWPVGERIGQGAFGDAFLIADPKTREKYVLKRIRMARQNEWQRTATRQEIKLGCMLQHPFIVKFVRSWIRDGHEVNIVYAYCSQGDLQTVLRKQKGKHVEEKQLRRWLAELLLALYYMQTKHVLHRDLKSSNIFLTAENDVQIGDFGLATIRDMEDSSNHDQSIVGTPHFMSPEVLNRKKYDFKTDVWSLGCVVYELTALRSPFNAFNLNGLVSKICKSAVAPLPSHYSEDWGSIIKWMLRKSADKRPSVEDLLGSQSLRCEVLWAYERALQLSPGLVLPPLALPAPLLRQLSTVSSCAGAAALLGDGRDDDLAQGGDDGGLGLGLVTPERGGLAPPAGVGRGGGGGDVLAEDGSSSEEAKRGALHGSGAWRMCGKVWGGGEEGDGGGLGGGQGPAAAPGSPLRAKEAEAAATAAAVVLPAAAAAPRHRVAAAAVDAGDVKARDVAKAGKGAAAAARGVPAAPVPAVGAGARAAAVPAAEAPAAAAAAAACGTKRVRRHSSLVPSSAAVPPAIASLARLPSGRQPPAAAEPGPSGAPAGAAVARSRTVRVTRQLGLGVAQDEGAAAAAAPRALAVAKGREAGQGCRVGGLPQQQGEREAAVPRPAAAVDVAAGRGAWRPPEGELAVEPPNKRVNNAPTVCEVGVQSGPGGAEGAGVEVAVRPGGCDGGGEEVKAVGDVGRGRERKSGAGGATVAGAKATQPPWRPGSLTRASGAAAAAAATAGEKRAAAAAVAPRASAAAAKALSAAALAALGAGGGGDGAQRRSACSVERQAQEVWHSSQGDSQEGEAPAPAAPVVVPAVRRAAGPPAGVPRVRSTRLALAEASRNQAAVAAVPVPDPGKLAAGSGGPGAFAAPQGAAAAGLNGRPEAGAEDMQPRSPSCISMSGQLLCEEFSLLSLPPPEGLVRSSSCSSLSGKTSAAGPASTRPRSHSQVVSSGGKAKARPVPAGSAAGSEALSPRQVEVPADAAAPQLFDNELFQSPNSRKQGSGGSSSGGRPGAARVLELSRAQGPLDLPAAAAAVAAPPAVGDGPGMSLPLPACSDLSFAGFAAVLGSVDQPAEAALTPPFPVHFRAAGGECVEATSSADPMSMTPSDGACVTRRLTMSSGIGGGGGGDGAEESPMQPGSLGKWFGAAAEEGGGGSGGDSRRSDAAAAAAASGRDAERLLTLERIVALASALHEMGRWHELGNVLSSLRLNDGGGVGAEAAPDSGCGSPGSGARALNIGDKVIVGSQKGIATIRYFGPCHWAAGDHVGLELDRPEGKHQGEVDGIVYFRCPPMHGTFVKSSMLKPGKA